MIYLILFWHDGDQRASVRVVRGTRAQADLARTFVEAIYNDPDARVIEIHDDHDDFEDLKADYAETVGRRA
ncbi:MAG TPA: hypothetical protein VFB99_01630 [Vicinamibacterales bacterium]|nr:hypothetical protein [Vicinamibacterales bacterium]